MGKNRSRDRDYRAEMQLMINLAEDPQTDDRTIAVASLAHIEDALAEMLRANLEGYSSELEKTLFAPGGSAPLSTFGDKVVMCEGMALIYPKFASELRRLAKIRNLFAHQLTVDRFDHELVRDHVDQLHTLRDESLLLTAMLVIPPDDMTAPSRRRRFTYSAVSAALALNGEEDVMLYRIVRENLVRRSEQ